jgi:8-oxo-dGTP pyrophosphatase MutT (NUDIX family)
VTGIRRLSSTTAYRSPYLTVTEDAIEYPDGTRSTYSLVSKPDFALVIPLAEDGFWLVEQFRYPVGRRCWEFPQGGWAPGSERGTPAELAVAELREETGLSAGGWQHLGRLFSAYGYSGQAFDVWLATDLSAGEPDREHSEQDMVHRWFPRAEIRAMVADGRFADSQSLAALALFDMAAPTPPT